MVDPSVEKVLDKFATTKMYGSVEIKYQAGRVVLIRESKTSVPNDRQTERNMRPEDAAHDQRH